MKAALALGALLLVYRWLYVEAKMGGEFWAGTAKALGILISSVLAVFVLAYAFSFSDKLNAMVTNIPSPTAGSMAVAVLVAFFLGLRMGRIRRKGL